MKITSSNVSMSGSSSFVEKSSSEERLKMWMGNKDSNSGNAEVLYSQQKSSKAVILDLSDQSQKISSTDTDMLQMDISDKDKQKIVMIQEMIKLLTGKRIKFLIPQKINIRNLKELKLDLNFRPLVPITSQKLGWGMEYDYSQTQYQSEKMNFSSIGTVKTADGKEINFSVNLSMNREFMSQTNISVRAGDAVQVDPLVINFSNSTAALTDTKYSFDLDSDGKDDQISFVTSGSGFLALDLNNDGTINNGSELFGPNSGDGFKDLSAYDTDGNNWIDENDPIYDKLRIWTKDADGQDKLFALGQKGIGAIYLGNVNTKFSINDSQNNKNGQIRKTGVFLNENGTCGTIQHIDLVI